MWTVYRHVSPSGKVYIGITSTSTTERWSGKAHGYGYNPAFFNAIKKYGWENITHEILYENINEISAKLIEIDLIYYYKKKGLSYNITDGGAGTLGRKQSKAFVEALIERNKGNTYGAHPCSEETKRKIAKKNGKPVLQIDLETREVINEYESCHDVYRKLGIDFRKISAACLSGRVCENYLWKYK